MLIDVLAMIVWKMFRRNGPWTQTLLQEFD